MIHVLPGLIEKKVRKVHPAFFEHCLSIFKSMSQVPVLSQTTENEIGISVLVNVINSQNDLQKNLQSYFAQQYPYFEIIFRFKEIQQESLEIVKDYQQKFPDVDTKVVLDHIEKELPDYIYKQIAYKYLLIIDSDLFLENGYLANLMRNSFLKNN